MVCGDIEIWASGRLPPQVKKTADKSVALKVVPAAYEGFDYSDSTKIILRFEKVIAHGGSGGLRTYKRHKKIVSE